MARLRIAAPLSGWSTPLGEVPDLAFAQRMVGDGVAIDPVDDTLCAPCDGEVISLAEAAHAVTLRAAGGIELLMHVGIDTVRLGGRGFTPVVHAGSAVHTGDPLIRFDLDLLARSAPSVVTPILLIERPGFSVVQRFEDRRVRVGEPLFEIEGVGTDDGANAAGRVPAATVTSPHAHAADALTARTIVRFEHGLHARPAAQVAHAMKAFAAQASLDVRGRTADARSPIALMALGARRGDTLELRVSGRDAAAALERLLRELEAGDAHGLASGQPANASVRASRMATGLATPTVKPPPAAVETASVAEPKLPTAERASAGTPAPGDVLRGVTASAGLAAGVAMLFEQPVLEIRKDGDGAEIERAALAKALGEASAGLDARIAAESGALREVLEAHRAFIEDPALVESAQTQIAQGRSAAFAWRYAVDGATQALGTLNDARMAERVADLEDIAQQVLTALAGRTSQIQMPERAIVIADELLPSQFASLKGDRLAGICMARGGATSHVAILAAAAGIPALVAAGPQVLHIAAGTALLLDADRGSLHVAPGTAELAAAESREAARRVAAAAARARAHEDCFTADGARIEIFANVGSLADAHAAIAAGAEGCGLLRTEFLFLDRQLPPDETEQRESYQAIVDVFDGRPVTIRTLDAGGDKPIPYLPLPHEDNPALGLRGVRTSLLRPDLLAAQLNAIAAIEPSGSCSILLPMINSVAEIQAVRRLLTGSLPLGIMIETPAAALSAGQLAAAADFFSFGTNDLTQYTLAMDRGSPQLAAGLDGLDPAVLRLMAIAAESAATKGRKISVCGGLGSDLAAMPILIGLGVRTLSMVPSMIAAAKALIRTRTLDRCRALAREALLRQSAAEVRALAAEELP